MKKTIITLTVLFAGSAFAGIPVIDPAALVQATELVIEAKNQLKELHDQVNTAKSQLADFKKEAEATKKRLEGYSDFSSYFDSSSAYLKDTLDNASKSLSSKDLNDFFDQNNIAVKSGSGQEDIYKAKVEKIKTYERLQGNLSSQTNKMDSLQRSFERATTPQQKQDILNAVQMERLKMDTTLKAVDYELKKQDQEKQVKENEIQRKYMDNEMSTPEIKGEFTLK